MLDFLVSLITYIIIALMWFIAALVVSIKECKDLNAKLSRKVYRVNYKACFFKSLFFPLTLINILAELIKDTME